jgi:hypothetical protein
MKNWSVEHTNQINSWLNLHMYRKFEHVTILQLYHEMLARTLFFKSHREELEAKTMVGYFDKILNGNPFLIDEGLIDNMPPTNSLLQPHHTSLTTTDRLIELSCISMQRKILIWEEGDKYSINEDFREKVLSEILPDQFTKTVMFEIDLESGNNEEIVESIKFALPQWRKIKKIDENPQKLVRFGYSTIRKIINYRIIPMLDILAWAQVKQVRVSDDRLSRLLYTDDCDESDIRFQTHIKDSDRPLAIKMATIDFIRQFHYFLIKNNHLRNLKVSDVVTLN